MTGCTLLQAKEKLEKQIGALQKSKEGLRSGLKATKAQLNTALLELKGLQKQAKSVEPQLARHAKECAQLQQDLTDTVASKQRAIKVSYIPRMLLPVQCSCCIILRHEVSMSNHCFEQTTSCVGFEQHCFMHLAVALPCLLYDNCMPRMLLPSACCVVLLSSTLHATVNQCVDGGFASSVGMILNQTAMHPGPHLRLIDEQHS